MIRCIGILLLCILPLLHAQTTQEIPTEGLVPLRPAPEAQFAFLCVNDTAATTPEAFKASLVKWFKLKDSKEIKHFSHDAKNRTFSWMIGRSKFVATQEMLPMPKDDIRYSSNNSLHWPDAEATMLKHQTHYTVNCVSIHRTPWHATLDLTKAIAALAEMHDTTGIYWGDASIVHPPEMFMRLAKFEKGSEDKIPSSLWVGLLFESNTKGGWNIFTKGMEPLGFREMEIHSSQLQRSELFSFLNALKRDIISGEVQLSENMVIEDLDGNEWKATTGKSIIGREAPVWILNLEMAE